MKKFLTIALAITLVVMVAAPAMATDVSFSGAYRVRGYMAENLSLDDRDANDQVMSHRFRLQTKFAINDMLAVTTRFDAMDGRLWGVGDGAGTLASDFDWDRSWMTIRTGDYGTFDVGRMAGGTWGTTFIDTEGNADRVKWVYSGIENWTLAYIYQANIETDGGNYTARVATVGQPQTYPANLASDQDSDTHHAFFVYKAENWSAGLLYAYTNNKTVSWNAQRLHSFLPYFSGDWGPFHLQGEFRYNNGENDRDPSPSPATGQVFGIDQDIESWAWNIEGTYDFGPAKVMLGGAFVSGEDRDATQLTAFGGFGGDWAYPVYILAGNDEPWTASFGGVGNLSGAQYGGGSLMWYGGVSFSPIETVTLAANFAWARADETENIVGRNGVRGSVDDDQGSELDLILDWKIYDNLSYHAVVAWYWAGEYWRDAGGVAGTGAGGIPDASFDDAKAFFNQLLISF